MKKIQFLIVIVLLQLTTTYVQATSFSNYLPGGKNYLNEGNFTISGNTLQTIDPMKIKPNTMYTISFPGEGLLEAPELMLFTNNSDIFDGELINYDNCTVDINDTICTFSTDADDSEISLSLTAVGLSQYYSYYQMENMQLEEGSMQTEYEPYVEPFIDSSSPEINGAGAYIKSYESTTLIEDIIMDHLLVLDDVDGDLTSEVEILSDAYTGNEQIVGEYIVELKATDSSGNSAYFTLTVVVKDEKLPEITGPERLIVAFDSTKTIEELISENYTANDEYSGNVTVLIDNDSYTASKNQIGTYDVTITASDSSSNTQTKMIQIDVVDTIAPSLTSDSEIDVYHSNPVSYSDIINGITFTDDYDDQTTLIQNVISETYSTAENNPGTYNIVVQAIDSSGNQTEETILIRIIDDIAPEIIGPESIAFSYTESRTINDLVSLYTVSDNHTNLVFEDLTITSETFTTRNQQVGTYFMTLEVQDASMNSTSLVVQIDIIDDQKPIIYVDNMIITLGDNVTFTEEDALNVLIKNHEIPDDDYVVRVVNDEYTGNEHIPGEYLYSIIVEDTEGNQVQKDFMIHIPEEKAFEWDETLLESALIFGSSVAIILIAFIKRKK